VKPSLSSSSLGLREFSVVWQQQIYLQNFFCIFLFEDLKWSDDFVFSRSRTYHVRPKATEFVFSYDFWL
jgi:hypothetical protein